MSLVNSIARDGEDEQRCVDIPAPWAPAKRLKLHRGGVTERFFSAKAAGLLFSFYSVLLSLGNRVDVMRAMLTTSGPMAWHWHLEEDPSWSGGQVMCSTLMGVCISSCGTCLTILPRARDQ